MAARKRPKVDRADPVAIARRVVRRGDASISDLATELLRLGLARAIDEDLDATGTLNLLIPIASVIKASGKDGERSLSDELAELFGSDTKGRKPKTVGRK